MIQKSFENAGDSPSTHLIGDDETGRAVLIDPGGDVRAYVEAAEELGLVIAHVFSSHLDAEILRSLLQLRLISGARLHVTADAPPLQPLNPIFPGSTLTLGNLRVHVQRGGAEGNGVTVTTLGSAGEEKVLVDGRATPPLRRPA